MKSAAIGGSTLRAQVSGSVEFTPGQEPRVQGVCSGTTSSCGNITVRITPHAHDASSGVAAVTVRVSDIVERRGECIDWNTSATGQRTTCRDWRVVRETQHRTLTGGVRAWRASGSSRT